jgi:type II secretory pathway predicted ATPase ExeA
MKFQPIVLKRLVIECGFTQADFATAALNGQGKESLMNLIMNRNYAPPRIPKYKTLIENFIKSNKTASDWLAHNRLKVAAIWNPLGEDMRLISKNRVTTRRVAAMVPGDPGEINPPRSPLIKGDGKQTMEVETEMLTGETLKHFRLFRSPFQNDIRDVQDIYMSDEHRYIAEAMGDAARHGGFLAVIGEVGSGKSVIRKKVVAVLSNDDNSRIIYPRMIDKTRVTASSLCDAIVMDLCDETPKSKLEQKTRQVERVLVARSKAGCHVCLMVEEAQDLPIRVLKLLKRFYEIEDGYKKALGIILIGQPELGALFNDQDHYDMREVTRRCQVAYIRGLNGNMKDYLALKFKRVNVELKSVITDDAIAALSKRLTEKDGRGKTVSNAYPLTVNNYVIRAMNLACDMGEAKVTADVINNL